MNNNNTADVAYLGEFLTQTLKKMLLIKQIPNSKKCPSFAINNKPSTAVFDCNGTRYGFRIKKLKN